MKRRVSDSLVHLFLVLILFLQLSQSSSTPVQARGLAQVATGTVSGKITNSADDPIPNIPVILIGSGEGGFTCTNTNGEFTLTAELNVVWRIRAFPNGTNPCGSETGYAQQYWNNRLTWFTASTFTLTELSPDRTIDFVLQPGGGISGHVYQADGVTPISDVCINVSSSAPSVNQVSWYSQTGADGSFSFWGIPTGLIYIKTDNSCGASDRVYLDEWYATGGSVMNGNSATSVTIAANTMENGINFQLDPGAVISGKVVEEDEVTPIANASISILDTNRQMIQKGYSQADGTYSIGGLQTGSYYVFASATGFGGIYYLNGYDDLHSALVRVTAPNNMQNISFKLLPEATISGHVYQSDGVTPLGGVAMTAWPVMGGIARSATTALDGSYTFHGLSSGDYVVAADGNSQGLERKLYQDNLWWFLARPITVTQPNDTGGKDFNLSAPTAPPTSERQALINIYNQMGGPSWTDKTGWDSDANVCTWAGVACLDGHVASLVFVNNNLTNSLPTDWSGLPYLQDLEIVDNPIQGTVPAGLSTLTRLRALYLAKGYLTGSIPPQLSNLTNLAILALNDNQLTGTIPAELGDMTELRVLNLSNNRLSGAIPASLANLTGIADESLGISWWSSLGLNFNRLIVPTPYPSIPPTTLDNYLGSKNAAWYLNQSAEEIIPPQGGTITSQDGDTVLSFPLDSVDTPTTFEIMPQPEPENSTGSLQFANKSFQINALDTQGNPIPSYTFDQPVEITLEYSDADIAGIEESMLVLYYWDSTAVDWKDAASSCTPASDYTRNMILNQLKVNICHLSDFALLGIQSSVLKMIYLPITRR